MSTSYAEGTPDGVIDVLERVRIDGTRIRLFYGDHKSGVSWQDENDVVGQVGRSMGPKKIPILLYNRTSLGGGAILCKAIVAIKDKDRWLYRHTNFQLPSYTKEYADPPDGYTVCVKTDEHIACFTSDSKADRWIDFMLGKRFTK